jgi:hypothetical protein
MGQTLSQLNNIHDRLVNDQNTLNSQVGWSNNHNQTLNNNLIELNQKYDQTMRNYKIKQDGLNQQINRLKDLNSKYTKQLNDLSAMHVPDIGLINSYKDKINEINIEISKLTQEIIGKVKGSDGNYIFVPGTYTNQYFAIINQNDVLTKQKKSLEDVYLNYNTRSNFYAAAFGWLAYYNSIFFYIYYILTFYVLYLLYFKIPSWTWYFKLAIGFIALVYPFIINTLEHYLYLCGIYLLAIATGTPYHNQSASYKDIITRSTDLSVDK